MICSIVTLALMASSSDFDAEAFRARRAAARAAAEAYDARTSQRIAQPSKGRATAFTFVARCEEEGEPGELVISRQLSDKELRAALAYGTPQASSPNGIWRPTVVQGRIFDLVEAKEDKKSFAACIRSDQDFRLHAVLGGKGAFRLVRAEPQTPADTQRHK